MIRSHCFSGVAHAILHTLNADKAKLAGRLKLPGGLLFGPYERDRAAKALRGPRQVAAVRRFVREKRALILNAQLPS